VLAEVTTGIMQQSHLWMGRSEGDLSLKDIMNQKISATAKKYTKS